MKTVDEYIKDIPLDRANLEHIAEFKVINGTLLSGLREVFRAAMRDACKEQREICAGKVSEWVTKFEDFREAEEVINNAPEPTML